MRSGKGTPATAGGESLARQGDTQPPGSRRAPAPEGPEEIYRRFERLNRRGPLGALGGIQGLAGVSGKKLLFGVLAAVEVAALVLGLFFEVPFMDAVAFGLPGLLVALLGGSKDGDDTPDRETSLEKLLRRLGDPDSSKSVSRSDR